MTPADLALLTELIQASIQMIAAVEKYGPTMAKKIDEAFTLIVSEKPISDEERAQIRATTIAAVAASQQQGQAALDDPNAV